MNAEQRLMWIQSEVIKAMQEGLNGSITFHFSQGIVQSRQKSSNEKMSIDEKGK